MGHSCLVYKRNALDFNCCSKLPSLAISLLSCSPFRYEYILSFFEFEMQISGIDLTIISYKKIEKLGYFARQLNIDQFLFWVLNYLRIKIICLYFTLVYWRSSSYLICNCWLFWPWLPTCIRLIIHGVWINYWLLGVL